MEQILVMKSKRKDVLVKNVGGGPTLFQSPGQERPTIGQLFTAVKPKRIPNWIPKIGGKELGGGVGTSGNPLTGGQRLAAGLGLLGKVGAIAHTTNQVAQQAQAGNPLGAALSAGYTYEASDPTGKRTANMIQGQAPPTPSVEEQRANVPTVPLPGSQVPVRHGLDLQPSGSQPVAPAPAPVAVQPQVLPPPNPPLAISNTADREKQLQTKVDNLNQYNDALQPQPVQSMTQQPAAPQPASYNGNLPQPNAVTNPYANVNPQVGSMVQNLISGGMTGQGPVNPNNQQALVSAGENMGRQLGTQLAQNNAPPPVAPQPAPVQQAEVPINQNVLNAHQQNENERLAQEQLMGTDNNDNKLASAEFFASTLMEKLGADTVYKMNPHQVAMVSAYTFLKLS